MSSFTAWSDDVFLRQTVESNALLSLSRPADGDGVSPGEGWFHGLVDALDSHEQGVDGCEEHHFFMSHTQPLELEMRERVVLRAASPMLPFFLSV